MLLRKFCPKFPGGFFLPPMPEAAVAGVEVDLLMLAMLIALQPLNRDVALRRDSRRGPAGGWSQNGQEGL
jgi:hypothetical protein